MLWMHWCNVRLGIDDHEEFAKNATRTDPKKWPWAGVAIRAGANIVRGNACGRERFFRIGDARPGIGSIFHSGRTFSTDSRHSQCGENVSGGDCEEQAQQRGGCWGAGGTRYAEKIGGSRLSELRSGVCGAATAALGFNCQTSSRRVPLVAAFVPSGL